MYGGDEVSAIVLDLGSYTCKAGYAGEDAPKAVFPSVVGSIYQAGATDEVKHEKDSDSMYDSENADKIKTRKLYVGTQALGYRRDHMEVISPIKDGVVVDWDIVDNIWNHAFRERLLIDPKEHPMLLAEPSFNTPQQREKAAELMFESYKVPALFLAKNAVLTSFASGRATSLVVDSGGGSTTIAAVHDGYVLQKVIIYFEMSLTGIGILPVKSSVSKFISIVLVFFCLILSLSVHNLKYTLWLLPKHFKLIYLLLSTAFQKTQLHCFPIFLSSYISYFFCLFLLVLLRQHKVMGICLGSRFAISSHRVSTGLDADGTDRYAGTSYAIEWHVCVKIINVSLLPKTLSYKPSLLFFNLLCKRSFTLNKGSLCSNSFYAKQAVSTSPIGGEFLTDCMMKSLESKGVMIKPRYSFKRKEIRPGEFQVVHSVYPATVVGLKIIYLVNYSTVDLDIPNTTESYKLYSQRAIASDIKESVCRVPDTAFEESGYANVPMTPYELPDGQTIEIGADRFKIPDVLFNPSLVQQEPSLMFLHSFFSLSSVLYMFVIESINRCDADIKRELFSSILLAGGTASMLQLKERLEKELMEEAPQAARVKVLASGNSIERRFSVWIGGSILASLGSFQQLWFSKAEYEEHGVSNIQRKCP
ncbi:unnamed protein product [Musa acuminata subsp. burmannicoides]